MRLLIHCIVCLAYAGLLIQSAPALDYKRDIMPIFEEKCFSCHSEAEKVKGGLRLDDPKHLHGRFAKNNVVIPGDWDGSYLFVAVSRPPGAKDSMPPKAKKGDGKSLTPEEVMMVAKWIYEGARIDGERGAKGDKDDDPEEFLKFKDGVLVTDGYDAPQGEGEREDAGSKSVAKELPQEWINSEGKKIAATYKRVVADQVVLLLENGKTVNYPIAKLSKESREQLDALRTAEGRASR